jgi:hypothetical protein
MQCLPARLNLELNTRPKQFLGSLPLDIPLSALSKWYKRELKKHF